jgi:hypothetical protein
VFLFAPLLRQAQKVLLCPVCCSEGTGPKEGRRGKHLKGLKSCKVVSSAIISDGVGNMGRMLRAPSTH